jgi:peptidoglycan/xylan/chitin deacetylase (PgdA/CDA1 family)
VETILNSYDIRPIVAVIPDNQDVTLHHGPPLADFWGRMRRWQANGWTIGLHGYQHRYVTKSSGIIGVNRFSEFAGLPFDEQYQKLKAAKTIFQRELLDADIWVAPAHSFDWNTVRVLKQLEMHTISDGLHLWPYRDEGGLLWIPQQLGNFHKMGPGVWTVCLHLDDPAHADMRAFRKNIQRFRKSIVDVPMVQTCYGRSKESHINFALAKMMRWTKLQNYRYVESRSNPSRF